MYNLSLVIILINFGYKRGMNWVVCRKYEFVCMVVVVVEL